MKHLYKLIYVLFLFATFNSSHAAASVSLFDVDPPVITGNATVCNGSTVTLTATASAGATITWFDNAAGTGTPLGTGATYTSPVLTASVTYYAKATSGGESAISAGYTITVNAVPSIGGNLQVCLGSNSQLTPSGTSAGTWESSNTAVATVSSTGLVTTVGVGTTTITLTNSSGCEDTATFTVNSEPIASFTTEAGVQCASETISFTNTSTGSNLEYLWNFGNTASGTANTSTLQHPEHMFITTPGNGTQQFTVTLTVTNTVTGCQDVKTHQVTVKQLPDGAINSSANFDVFNNEEVFSICGNEAAEISFVNASTTVSTNTSYSIDWGDGSSTFTGTNWSLLDHTYAVGFWTLTYSVTGSNGCIVTKTYRVFVGSNPQVSFGTNGNTDICIAETLTFPITGVSNNPPGTIYTITFNDGSAPLVFNHPPPASVTHTFLTTSCGTTSSNGQTTFANSFSANIVASNPCNQSAIGVVPIYVSTPPAANFTQPVTSACTDTPVCLTNSTTGGNQIGSSGNSCNTTPKVIWSITPSTGVTLSSGSYGNDFGSANYNLWTTGSNSICPVFSIPGTYTITLKTANRCGTDIETKTICIKAPLQPTFTKSIAEGCTPLDVTTTNTTNLANQCEAPTTYAWNVTYSNTNCGTTGAPVWSFTNGTTASSPNPSFNFVTPGTYSISVTMNSGCGAVTSQVQTVVVKRPPTVTINPIASLCGASSVTVTPQANVENCGSQNLTYLWSFPGGTPSTSTQQNPGPVTYSTAGNYTITLAVTNECGTTDATQSFTITPTVVANAGEDKTICAGSSATLQGLASGGTGSAYTYQWSPSTGLSSATIANPVASPSTTTTYTLTVTNTDTNCTATDQVVVTVNTVTPGTIAAEQTICSGEDPAAFTETTAATGAGSLTYQWQSSANNITFTDIQDATSATYDAPALTQTTYYRRVVTSTIAGVACTANSSTIEITVNSITPGAISNDQAICTGGDPVAFTNTTLATGSGAISYQWQSSIDNVTFSNITGATSPTYDAGPLTQTTYYQRIASSLVNGVTCQAISNILTVTVEPDPIVTTQPLDTQTICQNQSATMLSIVTSGGVGAPSYNYQWYSSNTSTGPWTSISGAVAESYSPPTATVGTKYYYCKVTTSASGCEVNSAVAQVTVVAAPSITQQPSGSTVCIGGAPTVLNIAYSGGIGTASIQWHSNVTNITTGGISIPGATTSSYQPLATDAGTTYYYAEVTFSEGGCSFITSTPVAVIVHPDPVIATQPVAEQNICIGGSSAQLSVSYAQGHGIATYQWYINTIDSNAGGTAINGATSSTYTPPVYTTAGDYYYYAVVTLSGSGCGTATSDVAAVHVVADPVVTTQPITEQTLCLDAPAAELSVAVTGGFGDYIYQWYSNTSNSTTGGTPIAVETNAVFTPLTSAVGVKYYYCEITTAASGCSVKSNTAKVQVIPAPTFTTQPIGSEVCIDGTPTLLTVAYVNGTGTASYQWYSNATNTNTGGTSIPGATTSSFQPSAAEAGTTYYYAEVNFSEGGCSFITSNPVAVAVHPDPVIATQPVAEQNICIGGSSAQLSVSYAQGHGSATYQWFTNTNDVNTGGTAINGATSSTYTPPVYTTAGNYYYYAVITLSGSGCGIATSDVAAVHVVADPVVTTQPLTEQTLCLDAPADELTVTATGGFGDHIYQWYSNTSNSNTGGTQIAGANTSTFTSPTSTVGVIYYYCEITTAASGCSVKSNTAKVEVIPAPTFTTQPIGSEVCIDGTPTLLTVAYVNGTGTASYQWYSNATNTNTGGTSIPGAITSSFQPLATEAGTTYYYAVVTFSEGGCSFITSNPVAVIVHPDPVIATQPVAEQNICIGGTSAQLSVSYSQGHGTATYQWYINTIDSNTGGTAINGATSSTYTPPVYTTAGDYYYYAIVTLSGSGCGTATSDVAAVHVVDDPVVTAQPLTEQTLCLDAPASELTVTVTGGIGGHIYQWYSNPTNSTTGGTQIAGANTFTFTPPTSTVGVTYYYCEITTAASGCSVKSNTAKVEVIPAPTFTTQPQPEVLCIGETATPLSIAYTNGTGTATYQWYSNSSDSTPGTEIPGATSETYEPIVNTLGTTYYYCVVSFSEGGCSFITSSVVAITVNPVPVVTTPQSTIACSETGFTITPTDGGGNIVPEGTTYTWSMPTGTGFTGGSSQTTGESSISQTLINNTNETITATYNVTPKLGDCNGSAFTVTVQVKPTPVIPNQAQTICSEGIFEITPVNNAPSVIVPNSTTYSWDIPTLSPGLAGGEAGTDASAISGTLLNSTNSPQTAIYTVVPVTDGCEGASFTVTITVNPVPAISTTLTETICSGGTFTITPQNETDGIIPDNISYSWESPAAIPGIEDLASGTDQTAISGVLTNTTNAPITIVYTVTPKAGNCTGQPFTVEVVVQPTPTVNDIDDQTICNGEQTAPITFSGNVAGTIYTWSNSNPGIGLPASGTGDIASFAAINTGTEPISATITVTPSIGVCTGAAETFTIIVNPAPTVQFSHSDQAICSSTLSAAVTLTSATPNTSFSWTATQPDGITGVELSGTDVIPAQMLVNSTSSPIDVIYTASAQTTGVACPGPIATYTITVNPVPFVNGTINEQICSGTQANIIPADGGANNMPFGTTFTWEAATGNGFTGGAAQTTPQNSINPTLINTTNVPVEATFIVTPYFADCAGVPFEVVITVNPTASINDVAATICNNGTFTVDPAGYATNLPENTVYSWSVPIVTGGITGGEAGINESSIMGTLTNPSTIPQTATYTVTPISPLGNCEGESFTVTITVNPEFTVIPSISDYNGFEISTADGTDGWIDITPGGGSGTYIYDWQGPDGFSASTQDVSNLSEGTYTVEVSDGICDPITLTFELHEPLPLVVEEVVASHVDVDCFGETTGVIEVMITQVSIAPFDYAIFLDSGTLVESVNDTNATTFIFDNLAAGVYDVQVTDANGTIKYVQDIVISQPDSGLAISNAVVSDFNGFSISCFGADNGSIDIEVTGGTPDYFYSWSGPVGYSASTQDISSLPPGIYTVVISDATESCSITQTYTITEPEPLSLTSLVSDFNGYSVSCAGGNNGSINITPTGGTGTYIYQWSGPNGLTGSTQDLENLYAGTYQLILSDSNGCVYATQTYVLTEPPALSITETHANILCFGDATGAISIAVTGGVHVPGAPDGYNFSWAGPNGFSATTKDLSGIFAGIYTLTVTDNSGCSSSIQVTITQNPEISITAATTPITCYGANDASITLTVSGGVGPYTAAWDNLATGLFQDNLAAGDYTIIITDALNCVKTIIVNIPEAPIFTVNPVVNQISCNGANDGSISLNLVGGIAPITLAWSDGSTAGTTRNNLAPGVYTATILDGTPCEIVRTFTIIEPQPLTVGSDITDAFDCEDPLSGAIDLHVGGGSPPYTFTWTNGATTEDLTGITNGNYAVTITDGRGCSISRQFVINRPQPLELNIESEISFNCDTNIVRQRNIAIASGGVPPFQYSWSTGIISGQYGHIMETSQNGTLMVTATDSMGCTVSTTFEVDTQQLGIGSFTVDSYAFTTYGLYSIIDPIHFVNTSTGDYIGVAWDFGDGSVSTEENPTHSYLREGTYRVIQTVTYPYGCVDTSIITIVIEKGYDIMIPNGFTPNGDSINDLFNAQHRGLKSVELYVYDTWGSMLYFEKGETLRGWEGTLNGVPSENGNYVYKINATTFYGHILEFTGPFTLIK